MTKKPMLIALSVMSCAAVAGVAFLTSAGAGASLFALRRDAPVANYTLNLNYGAEFGTYGSLAGGGFTYTNERGNVFGFFKSSATVKNSNSAVLHYYGNEYGLTGGVELIRSGINTDPTLVESIKGMQSITVDFAGDVTPTLYYGFIDDGVDYYPFSHVLEDNVPFDFEGRSPDCFWIGCSNGGTDTWYTCDIVSLSLTYSCSSSDAAKNAFIPDLFAPTPRDIVKDGEDNITGFTSGAYPQTLVDSETAADLESNYTSMTALNGKYYFNRATSLGNDITGFLPSAIKVYTREQATSTGYNNEYVAGNYYWFAVERVAWKVISSPEAGQYFATTEKVIHCGLNFHNSDSLTLFKYSTLGQYVNTTLRGKLFSSMEGIADNTNSNIEAKLYPLTEGQYSVVGKVAGATDYARTMSTFAIDVSTGATYWTNVYVTEGGKLKGSAIQGSGSSANFARTNFLGVRPGMTITIE